MPDLRDEEVYLSLEKKVPTNDFGDLNFSPVETSYWQGQSHRCRYLDEATSPMTVINLQGVYEGLSSADDVLPDITYLTQWHGPEDVASQEYQDHLNHFNSNVYFLTGNLSKGGIFFYKYGTADSMFMGCVYCVSTREEQEEQQVSYYIGTNTNLAQALNTDYELEEVCFGFLESLYEEFPNIVMFAKLTNSQGNVPITVFDPYSGSATDMYPTNSLAEAVGEVDHGWLYDAVTIQNFTNIYVPEEGTYSGSWDGGAAIDPSYNPYPDDAGQAQQEDNTDKPGTDKIDVDDPNASGIDACNSGFVTLYNPTKQAVIDFNNYLFTDITDSISQQLKRLISDPLEYVIFVAMCHFVPTQSIVQHNIVFAGIDSGVSAPIISPQFKQLDCGTIQIPNHNKNFTDYSPMSKAYIYLPYIGFRELKIDEIRGATLSLVYRIDLMTGSFVATLRTIRGLRGFWTGSQSKDYEVQTIILVAEGNCYEMLPLSATDYRNFYQGLMGVIGGGMSVASGNVAGGLASMGTSVASMKPSVNRSGNPTGNYGYFGNQTAYVVIEMPFGANPAELGEFEGYPANLCMEIGTLADAYCEIDPDTIWMNDIPCFDDEMSEIKDLLNKGVYVNDVDKTY